MDVSCFCEFSYLIKCLVRGENGKPGTDGVSFGKVERSKQKCIVCPAGPQGKRCY